MKISIIGCGSIGERHLNNLLMFVSHKQIIVHDIDKNRLKYINNKYKIIGYSDFREALSTKPDIVFITTPTSLHIPFALQALEARCHLFIEKPISHSLEGIDKLQRLASAKKLTVMVGCNMRFHPGISAIKKLLIRKKIGKVISARIEYGHYLPNWHPCQNHRKGYSANRYLGGGIILDAIHELDYARWFFGEPQNIFCLGARHSNVTIDTEDTASMVGEFKSGVIVEIHLDYIQRPYSRSCKIVGEKGVIEWNLDDNLARFFDISNNKWVVFYDNTGYDINQMYIDELRYFINCVRENRKPMVDINDAKRSLILALSAKDSIRNSKVIKIG